MKQEIFWSINRKVWSESFKMHRVCPLCHKKMYKRKYLNNKSFTKMVLSCKHCAVFLPQFDGINGINMVYQMAGNIIVKIGQACIIEIDKGGHIHWPQGFIHS